MSTDSKRPVNAWSVIRSALADAVAVSVGAEEYELYSAKLDEIAREADDKIAQLKVYAPKKIDQRPNGCYPACLAMLTNVPMEELVNEWPDEMLPGAFSKGDEKCMRRRNENTRTLRRHGWRVDCIFRDVPLGFSIASGMSPRGVMHSVVVLDGHLWHDPHESRAGVANPEYYEICTPFIPRTEDRA